MEFEIKKDALVRGVSLAEKITGKNVAQPVLSTILIDAGDDMVTLRSTNLDLGMEISIPATVTQKGTVAVQGNILTMFVTGIKVDAPVKIKLNNGNLSVNTKKNSTLIKAQPHDAFPTIPRVVEGIQFTLPAHILVQGLKSVWFCASISSIKQELSSVYIYTTGGQIVFVATDSFRLAEKRIPAPQVADFGHILIPHKNIPEIIRVLEAAEGGDVQVSLNKNQVSFEYGSVFLVSRVIDGVFPDYKQIIPKEFTTEVTLLKQDIVDALKLSTIFSDKFNQVNVRVVSKDAQVSVTTKNSDIGENENMLNAVVEGEDIEVNFNHKYMYDVFQVIATDSLCLQFTGKNRPMIMRPIGDTTFMYLVMPMNK